MPSPDLQAVASLCNGMGMHYGWEERAASCAGISSIRKSHLDLERFRELQYFQKSHGALGASGCLSKIDIFLGVFGYLSEMAQRCIFTWVSLDIFERSLKHLSKIFQRCIVPWVSPGGFQIPFRHVYLLECL